jgi:hypothetical protein
MVAFTSQRLQELQAERDICATILSDIKREIDLQQPLEQFQQYDECKPYASHAQVGSFEDNPRFAGWWLPNGLSLCNSPALCA